MESFESDPEVLRELVRATMPFGRFRGEPLYRLPEAYLVWMSRQGLPRGKLGRQLALMLEIKHNGLLGLLEPIIEQEAEATELDD